MFTILRNAKARPKASSQAGAKNGRSTASSSFQVDQTILHFHGVSLINRGSTGSSVSTPSLHLLNMSASGIDLCQYPALSPPAGVVSNFNNPVTLAPVTIAVSSILTALSIIFVTGRLVVNRKNLQLGDCQYLFQCCLHRAGFPHLITVSCELTVTYRSCPDFFRLQHWLLGYHFRT